MTEPAQRTERKRTLTDADLKALYKLIQAQPAPVIPMTVPPCKCRFENVSTDEMGFLMDLLKVYKETRSEFIKWLVKGAIYGSLLLVALSIYFKTGKH